MSTTKNAIREALLKHLPDLQNNEKILEECQYTIQVHTGMDRRAAHLGHSIR